ncbi:MAG: hypothetical protein EA447_05370, partial [Nitrosopumilus sp.]
MVVSIVSTTTVFAQDDHNGDHDPDGDGIPDSEDHCPDDWGPPENNGCPDHHDGGDHDPDGDGIPDSIDSCPDDAEDFNGWYDDDGCPDGHTDDDGDGIPVDQDLCPDAAENFNGFEDTDGCPDTDPPTDEDGDGYMSDYDQCPTEPENFNGYEDEDGCPDTLPADSDGDGIPDSSDACPNEYGTQSNGCPEPLLVENIPPVIIETSSASTIIDTPTDIPIIATDVDGDSLTFSVTGPPRNGIIERHHSLTSTSITYVYVPHSGFTGTDSFVVTANDGIDTGSITVTVSVVTSDVDGDGYSDNIDACPHEYGTGSDGCPLQEGPSDELLQIMQNGLDAMENGNCDLALNYFEDALTLNEYRHRVLAEIAILYLDCYGDAYTSFDYAVESLSLSKSQNDQEAINYLQPLVMILEEMIDAIENSDIIIPFGSALPGCEKTNSCYIPYSFTVNEKQTVTWYNQDSATHTVTSGVPASGHDGVFDSSLISPGDFWSFTPDGSVSGTIPYFCSIHPWMIGELTVHSTTVSKIPQPSNAVNINFDSVNTSGGTAYISDVLSYLSQYGVSISNVNPSGNLQIVHDTANSFAVQILQASSGNNVFWCDCPNKPYSYDVYFDFPLDTFSFTRTAYISATSSGVVVSPWSATAYDEYGNVLSTVSEGRLASYGTIQAKQFTLNGPDIAKVTFSRSTENTSAGVNRPPTDNWILVPSNSEFTTPVTPSDPYSEYIQLAMNAGDTGNFDQAIDYSKKALQHKPNDALANFIIAGSYYYGYSDYNNALNYAKIALKYSTEPELTSLIKEGISELEELIDSQTSTRDTQILDVTGTWTGTVEFSVWFDYYPKPVTCSYIGNLEVKLRQTGDTVTGSSSLDVTKASTPTGCFSWHESYGYGQISGELFASGVEGTYGS